MTHSYGRKWRGTKKPLDESKRGDWKSWLKAQHSENEDHGTWSHHFMGNRWGNSGNCVRLYFQFSSVAHSCLTLCDPMNCSTPGLHVHHQLPEFTQTHIHRISDAIQPSHPLVVPFSSCPQSLPASGSFPKSELFSWGGQSIGVSASASVLPVNTQDWSPLGWNGWISLQSKGLSRVFSSTTVQKHQFFGAQLSSQSNSHIHTWPQEKP